MKNLNSKTIEKLSQSPDIETLRALFIEICDDVSSNKISLQDIGPEFVRLGACISLPVNGPIDLMSGLHGLLGQLSGEFPKEWEAVQQMQKCGGNA